MSLNPNEMWLFYEVFILDSLWCALFPYSEAEAAESEEEGEDPTLDSLSQAIAFQASLHIANFLIQDEGYIYKLFFFCLSSKPEWRKKRNRSCKMCFHQLHQTPRNQGLKKVHTSVMRRNSVTNHSGWFPTHSYVKNVILIFDDIILVVGHSCCCFMLHSLSELELVCDYTLWHE